MAPFQVPAVIVPTVVVLVDPVYVASATEPNTALYDWTSVPILAPKLVLAVVASVAPVPPYIRPIVAAFQVPVVIVPNVVVVLEPVDEPEPDTDSQLALVLSKTHTLPSPSAPDIVATIPA